ncbi:hypothetical protein THASP1DRAFT_32256 [Thamnocephalis sphaerospora]|uniref:Transmembrane protein n=1 Tax=Thamnocephalis sphaerospora TaxID=78915 RepID=A0A4P9XJH5_9FUNG|nr:hypothetical protein THASP1DRAFT_32256 [Thamnocephalis sphaerospora]|eukprot:RKP05917.1 hypothetical protein THASP1DRAFT_32256 [Thamnocephalis sphaerospora]
MTVQKRASAAASDAKTSAVNTDQPASRAHGHSARLPRPSVPLYLWCGSLFVGFGLLDLAPQYLPQPLNQLSPTLAAVLFRTLCLIHVTEAYTAVVICRKRGHTVAETVSWASHVLLCGLFYLRHLIKTRSSTEYFSRLPIATYMVFTMLSATVAYAKLVPLAAHPAPLRVITALLGRQLVEYAFWLMFGIHTIEMVIAVIICTTRGYRLSTTLSWAGQTLITGMNGMHPLFRREV